MFLRRRSFHGRLMGEVRSAQQKCVRRAMLEPLISLQLEHLLSEPDMSRAAIRRLQIIAAEDVGVGSLELVADLVDLESGWPDLSRLERARRLIQAAMIGVARPASRFIPHWVVTFLRDVPDPELTVEWDSLEVLLGRIERQLRAGDWESAGISIEEVFLRHPIEKEEALPEGIHFPKDSMKRVWEVMGRHCRLSGRRRFESWRQCFGTPAKENIGGRLFLYLAVLDICMELPFESCEVPEVSDREVSEWLLRAERECFLIPGWMMDKHTAKGRRMDKGQSQFFEEATVLSMPSEVLGEELECRMRTRAKEIYFEEEALYGRESRTKHMRKRWRDRIFERFDERRVV